MVDRRLSTVDGPLGPMQTVDSRQSMGSTLPLTTEQEVACACGVDILSRAQPARAYSTHLDYNIVR